MKKKQKNTHLEQQTNYTASKFSKQPLSLPQLHYKIPKKQIKKITKQTFTTNTK